MVLMTEGGTIVRQDLDGRPIEKRVENCQFVNRCSPGMKNAYGCSSELCENSRGRCTSCEEYYRKCFDGKRGEQ